MDNGAHSSRPPYLTPELDAGRWSFGTIVLVVVLFGILAAAVWYAARAWTAVERTADAGGRLCRHDAWRRVLAVWSASD